MRFESTLKYGRTNDKTSHMVTFPKSKTLSRAAKASGLPARVAKQVVGFQYTDAVKAEGYFVLQADVESSIQFGVREDTQWLLDFIACPPEELPPEDVERPWRSLDSFLRIETPDQRKVRGLRPEPRIKPSRKDLISLRDEVAHALRAFVIDHKPWVVEPGLLFARRLEWYGGSPWTFWEVGDWRIRFKVRAIELLENAAGRIRQCRRCAKLFLADDRRQQFCTKGCARRAHLEKFKSKLSRSEWLKKRHDYYIKSKRQKEHALG
jgi:hypothetical protein